MTLFDNMIKLFRQKNTTWYMEKRVYQPPCSRTQSMKILASLSYMGPSLNILRTLSLPLSPIWIPKSGWSSNHRRWRANTGMPTFPTGWKTPVTFDSNISFVPPASVPSTCKLSKYLHDFYALWDATVGMLLLYFQGAHKCGAHKFIFPCMTS